MFAYKLLLVHPMTTGRNFDSVSNDEARDLFGEWEEPKLYIRVVPQPSWSRP